MNMSPRSFPYYEGLASIALQDDSFYYWDSSIIEDGGLFHLFVSRWPSSLGFGWNWLFNSEIVHLVSKDPAGPFVFRNVILGRRGPSFFDGMSTHNPCIKKWGSKYYLYYMGSTYPGNAPGRGEVSETRGFETWNRKRIGLAVSTSIDGPFVRSEVPLLEPRDCSKWDCTITTNPTVAILPDGSTYMIYKSRAGVEDTLHLGVAKALRPEGPFHRLTDNPILNFSDPNIGIEDPFLWYDEKRKKFCLIAKDDSKNGSFGLTGTWGDGFYAESDDCINFTIGQDPIAYSREVKWQNGSNEKLCNLERPSVLFDKNQRPIRLYFAGGRGKGPYDFVGTSFVLSVPLFDKK